MQVAEHIKAVREEGKRFADSAERVDLDAMVPTCPGWTVRDLVRHLGEIHLWAAGRISKRSDKLFIEDNAELTAEWPVLGVFWVPDDELIAWYRKTSENLVRELEAAPEDLDCPTFLPAPSPLAMWARRQAHETAVHRFDIGLAGGVASDFEAVFASDGVDELIAGFATRVGSLPMEETKSIAVQATDTGDSWLMTMGPSGRETVRGDFEGDATLRGLSSELYLTLWNRPQHQNAEVSGDASVLDLFRGTHQVKWDLN